jgi:TonB dependent receptor-like, beta-barrel
VSIATREGTNAFHGGLFEFFRNTALNSNEFFANAQGTDKPEIKLNQFGGEFGGPIRRNRTFFFANWQRQIANFSQAVDQAYGSVPTLYTPTALNGIYRYFVADPNNPFKLDGVTINRNTPVLVDPHTGKYRPGVHDCASAGELNCIASFNFFANDPQSIGPDAQIIKLFRSMPTPNSYLAGDGLNTAAYAWNPPAKKNGDSVTGRLDHNFNSNNKMFARYIYSTNDTLGGDPNNSRPVLYPGFPPLGEVYRMGQNAALRYTRIISPRVVNEFTAGMSRFGALFTQGEANPEFPNTPAFSRAAGTSFVNVDAPFRNVPRTFREVTTPQILDDLTVTRGSHIIKTGINFRFYRHNDQRGQPGGATVTPTLSFSTGVRAPASTWNQPAQAAAGRAGINATDFSRLQGAINDIMGLPSQLSQTFLGDLQHDNYLPFKAGDNVTLWNQGHRLKQYNFYVQDEWRIRRNLTLNAGLRWEINAPPKEASGGAYVPNKPIDGSQGLVTFVKSDAWFSRTNLGAIGPRLALAWSPARNTVLRAGYAMAFDTISSFQVTAVAGRVPGLTLTCSAVVGGAATPGCGTVTNVRYSAGFPSELPLPTTKPSSFLTPPPQVQTNALGMTSFDPNLKVPTVHQWNFSIQRELPQAFVAQVAYLGRRGTRLYRGYDINQISADPIVPAFLAMQRNNNKGCRPDGTGCPAGITGENIGLVTSGILTSTFVNSSTTITDLVNNGAGNFAGRIEQNTLELHLRPNQQFGTATYIDSGGDSYYHSLQATLRRRFRNGMLIGVAYTLSKSIDDQSFDPVASTSGGGLSTTNTRTPSDIRNWRNERGVSDFNRTHVLVTTWVYDLPFGQGHRFGANLPRAINFALGGWSLNGIFTAMTGNPFSVRSGTRTANFSHESRADLVAGLPEVKLTDVPGVVGPVYFSGLTSAFKAPAPGSNGMGRNLFVAPGYWNLDGGVTKLFHATESVTVQFRAEFFNALNHPNFDNPYGASSGSANYRSTVFGQSCCSTVAPPSTQTIVDTGESGRVIQFALKVRF